MHVFWGLRNVKSPFVQALDVLTNERQRRAYDDELRTAAHLAQAAAAAASSEADQPDFILADLKWVSECLSVVP